MRGLIIFIARKGGRPWSLAVHKASGPCGLGIHLPCYRSWNTFQSHNASDPGDALTVAELKSYVSRRGDYVAHFWPE